MKTRLLTILMQSVLAAVLGMSTASAETVQKTVTLDNTTTWVYSENTSLSSEPTTWNYNGVTVTLTPQGSYYFNCAYANGNLTVGGNCPLQISVASGTIVSAVATGSVPTEVTASVGTLTRASDQSGFTWSGSSSTVTFTPADDRDILRLSSIVLTIEADLNTLATTTSTGAEYRFHRNATPFVGVSLHAKTITAGIQEMYFDGFSASTDPMITESPTNGSTYLHMPAGSRLRLQGSESGSNVYVTRASFTYVSGNPDVSADGGEYDSSTGVWTGQEKQIIFLFNEDADIQLVQSEAAAYAKVTVTTYGRGQTAVDGVGIDLENDLNGNPTGTTTVYVAVGGSLALAMTPDDARHELSTASYTESYWDTEGNYQSNDTDFLNDAKENGSYTMWNIQHNCDVTIRYSWITHLISYHASGNGTINLVATYLDDDGTSMSYDQAEQMYGGEAARDNTEDRKISIGTGGTVNMIMTADTGYKLSSLMVNGVEMVNSENLAKDGSVYTYTINPLTAAQNISATFVNDTPEAYARLTEDQSGNVVLTFYYDANKTDGDYDIGPFASSTDRGWHSVDSEIKTVVFDESFANYRPVSTAYWFEHLSMLTAIEGIGNLSTANVTDMSGMFEGCASLTSLVLSGFNTASVTSMLTMFDSCSGLTSLDLRSFDTSNVLDMGNMFAHCSGLTSLDVSSFNTANVTSMRNMFYECSSLSAIDISSFNTAKVTNMEGMFTNCYALTTIYAGSEWSTENVTESTNMFYSSTSIKGGRGTMYSFDGSHLDHSYARIDGGPDSETPGYFTDINAPTEYDVLVTVVGNGSVSIENGTIAGGSEEHITMPAGGTMTLTLTPGEGYALGSLMLDDTDVTSHVSTSVEGVMTYTLSSIYDTHNITVTFVNNTPEAYAALSENNTVLTFYYDTNKDVRNGMSVGPFSRSSECGWYSQVTTIQSVVFDDSFVNCRPTSTSYWFAGATTLNSITGLSNLNTSEVTSMSNMFYNCVSLGSLDLSGFNTDNVTDMSAMFAESHIYSLNISSFNTANVTTMRRMFYNTYMTELDVHHFNTANVTDMNSMFGLCEYITSLDLSSFNTSKVENMGSMFVTCERLSNLDISSFSTENVTDMSGMFYNCKALGTIDLGHFTTGNVTNMSNMFNHCEGLTMLDLSQFNTANVTNMQGMFSYANALTSVNLSSFNTSKVTDMRNMFVGCSALTTLDLGSFNTESVRDMIGTFQGCSSLTTINVSSLWSTTALTSSSFGRSMFSDCTNLVGGAGTTYDAEHTDYTYAHIDEGETNPGYFTDINAATEFDVLVTVVGNGSVSIGSGTIAGGSEEHITMPAGGTMTLTITPNTGYALGSLMLDDTDVTSQIAEDVTGAQTYTLSSIYDTHNITVTFVNNTPEAYAVLSENNTVLTFYYDTNKESRGGMDINTRSWDIENGEESPYGGITKAVFDASFANYRPTSTAYWFQGCRTMTTVEGMENLNTSNVTDMWAMFDWCGSLESIDLSYMNTSNAVYLAYMFNGCSSLTSLDVSRFSTDNATDIGAMFRYCSKLTTVDVSHFNTSKVTSFWGLFAECSSLTSLDVSNFDTGSAENMAYMFYNCNQVQSLDVSHFNTSNVTNMHGMFGGCSALTNLDVTSFNTQNVTDMGGMFAGCSGLTSLDVTGFNTQNVTDMGDLFFQCSNLTSLDVTGFNTQNVTNMDYMFFRCGALSSLDLSSFNTENVTSMAAMFQECGLSSIDVSNFNTSNVTTMREMFSGDQILTSLDLGNFNTAKVTDMNGMFFLCSALNAIYVGSNWITDNVTDSGSMFSNCFSIVGEQGTTYDGDHVGADYARVDGGSSHPGYLSRALQMGDANGDGDVNIADAVATVTYILNETSAESFYTHWADMNGDSTIDIFDVTLIVNAVLSASPAPAFNGGNIAANDVRLEAKANNLTMGINGNAPYTAFQFDVTLPEGTTLEGVRLANKATNHQLVFKKVGDNTYRVVGLSMTNQQLSAANGRLVQLQLSGNADESNVTMSNVLFVGQPATDATAIRNHVADGAADRGAIYDLNGRYVGNDRRQLSKGIYIINHKKVNIK